MLVPGGGGGIDGYPPGRYPPSEDLDELSDDGHVVVRREAESLELGVDRATVLGVGDASMGSEVRFHDGWRISDPRVGDLPCSRPSHVWLTEHLDVEAGGSP